MFNKKAFGGISHRTILAGVLIVFVVGIAIFGSSPTGFATYSGSGKATLNPPNAFKKGETMSLEIKDVAGTFGADYWMTASGSSTAQAYIKNTEDKLKFVWDGKADADCREYPVTEYAPYGKYLLQVKQYPFHGDPCSYIDSSYTRPSQIGYVDNYYFYEYLASPQYSGSQCAVDKCKSGDRCVGIAKEGSTYYGYCAPWKIISTSLSYSPVKSSYAVNDKVTITGKTNEQVNTIRILVKSPGNTYPSVKKTCSGSGYSAPSSCSYILTLLSKGNYYISVSSTKGDYAKGSTPTTTLTVPSSSGGSGGGGGGGGGDGVCKIPGGCKAIPQ